MPLLFQSGGYQCTCCHESCKALGLCDDLIETGGARCSWSSCYSDVSFVKAILAQLQKEFCLDTSAVFAAGASNGAMLVRPHTLALIADDDSHKLLCLQLNLTAPLKYMIVNGAGASSCLSDATQHIRSSFSYLWSSAETPSPRTYVAQQHTHSSNTRPMGPDHSAA